MFYFYSFTCTRCKEINMENDTVVTNSRTKKKARRKQMIQVVKVVNVLSWNHSSAQAFLEMAMTLKLIESGFFWIIFWITLAASCSKKLCLNKQLKPTPEVTGGTENQTSECDINLWAINTYINCAEEIEETCMGVLERERERENITCNMVLEEDAPCVIGPALLPSSSYSCPTRRRIQESYIMFWFVHPT